MVGTSPEFAFAEVVREFPILSRRYSCVALGNHGGFSGAQLWRIQDSGQDYCLRAWPAAGMAADRLSEIHRLMQNARAAGLEFVPQLFPTRASNTWLQRADELWELSTWMPGRAVFHHDPNPARLQAACAALAQLHCAWQTPEMPRGPCPAVERRLRLAHRWHTLVQADWRPDVRLETAELRQCAMRGWILVRRRMDDVLRQLAPWTDRTFPLQPCLCDIWHDHVLFQGDHVSGIVDYGAIKLDHIAVDLARLLGSLIADDEERWTFALNAYRALCPLGEEETALCRVLDSTGSVLAVANWLLWLYHERRPFIDRRAVAGHLAGLVERLEKQTARL